MTNSKKKLNVRVTRTFARNLKHLLKKRPGAGDVIIAKASELADCPEKGKLIPGTDNLLWKERIADPLAGQGKRGGLRLIYAWKHGWEFIFLCLIYAKSEKSDATRDELERALLEIEAGVQDDL